VNRSTDGLSVGPQDFDPRQGRDISSLPPCTTMCRPDLGHAPRPLNYRGVRDGSRKIFACPDT